MRKSFKVRIFWHVILTTAIVIGANRLTAQHFLTDQLQTRIHQEMGIALDNCEANFQRPDAFLSCFKALEKGSLFSNISDFYLLCDRVNNTSSANAFPACSSLLAEHDFWRDESVFRQGDVEFAHGAVGAKNWYAVRFQDPLKGT